MAFIIVGWTIFALNVLTALISVFVPAKAMTADARNALRPANAVTAIVVAWWGWTALHR